MNKLYFVLLMLFLSAKNLYAQDLQTNISVHDPVIIKQDSLYYIFCTGQGIANWSSKDMIHWKREKPVFAEAPKWAVDTIPGFKGHIWAPDISYYNGLYYLYYSVSAFGKNTSAIGVATNKTLHTDDADYHWVDHGRVIQSYPGKTHWNAIDPNLITDKKGTPYLAFGSFWDGLKLVKLKKDRLSIDQSSDDLPTIASRKKDRNENLPATDQNPVDAGGNAIEGAFIFHKNNYYYLFASIDYCCKGPKSTYKMIIGRSKTVKGPYLDETGLSLAKGGGTILLQGDQNWYGVGHNAVFTNQKTDYLVFHGYDAADRGISKLRIEKLSWDSSGWPEVDFSK
ncbi:MAG: arabinan endo-1,5-alpha-L-arabinosidase [Sphingobacteriaceae bacterium]|nr:MAG: arabinan endo-1,5-alpha-L-arabinosidase [Sphingobacteriaceae bacterium]